MTEEVIVKLAGSLPKGDANGVADDLAATDMYRKKIAHRFQPPRIAVVVYDVKEAKAGEDGVDTVTLKVSRIEPVTTVAGLLAAEILLREEYSARTGQAMLPFELAQMSKLAFANLPRTTAEVDESEERERGAMSVSDELRRHLERVHGATELGGLTDSEMNAFHEQQHRTDMFTTGPLAHELSWHGWTRADLEQAEIETDDLPGEGPSVADDGPTLFDDGMRDAAEDEEDPDPDLGKDLDDEDDDRG